MPKNKKKRARATSTCTAAKKAKVRFAAAALNAAPLAHTRHCPPPLPSQHPCKNCDKPQVVGFYGCCSSRCQVAVKHTKATVPSTVRVEARRAVARDAFDHAGPLKERYFSITVGLDQKRDLPDEFFDDYAKFLSSACVAGGIGAERGTKDRVRHGQSAALHAGPHDEAQHVTLIKKQIRDICGYGPGDRRPGFKVNAKPFVNSQEWSKMIGYCIKDMSEGHFLFRGYNLTQSDIIDARTSYSSVSCNALKGKNALFKTTLMRSILSWKMAHAPDLALDPVQTLRLMMLTDRFMLNPDFCNTMNGIDVSRSCAWLRVTTEPTSTTARDIWTICFSAKDRMGTAVTFAQIVPYRSTGLYSDRSIQSVPESHFVHDRHLAVDGSTSADFVPDPAEVPPLGDQNYLADYWSLATMTRMQEEALALRPAEFGSSAQSTIIDWDKFALRAPSDADVDAAAASADRVSEMLLPDPDADAVALALQFLSFRDHDDDDDDADNDLDSNDHDQEHFDDNDNDNIDDDDDESSEMSENSSGSISDSAESDQDSAESDARTSSDDSDDAQTPSDSEDTDDTDVSDGHDDGAGNATAATLLTLPTPPPSTATTTTRYGRQTRRPAN